ncbi:hypothetical protein V502_10272 [Pseudogymnoascus sp. VKM F-4520 (FW-2644)]|nr:hypothetical protein V502_10272 [Pseudogymnoascus sp. VKM F-4520 (FW-2644)]
MAEEALLQDVMGQFPQLKTYNHGSLIFSMPDGVSRESLVTALEASTGKILSAIPWLHEQVVHVGQAPGTSGKFELAPWPADAPKNTLIRVRDCSDLLPSHEEMLKSQGPASMLDGNLICAVPGFPLRYDEAVIGPAPAAIIQVNWIKGGVILTFSNQHNVMDGSGVFQLIALLSTAMNGEEISKSAIEEGNRDRKTVVPLYGPDEPIRDHSHMLIKTPLSAAAAPNKAQSLSSWVFLRFWKKSVPEIKAMATDPVGYDKSVPFITSNDAISAFYWKRLAIARVRNGQDGQALSKFSRAIDARAVMGVSREYMGQMVYFSATWLTYQELVDLPLSTIASRMRKSMNESNNEFSVRSYATFVSRIQDRTTIAYGGPFNRETDIASSSMAQAAVVLKFGILGTPELVRRPNLAPIPGTLYFFPPDGSGDLNLLMCLTQQELEAMRSDPEWSQCTQYIG